MARPIVAKKGSTLLLMLRKPCHWLLKDCPVPSGR